MWNTPSRAQELGQERSRLNDTVTTIDRLQEALADNLDMLDLAHAETDHELFQEVTAESERLEVALARLEFQRMFSKELDPNPCYLDIQAGSGGTEAQDWAEMILRMYLRWAESKGFKVEILEASPGEVAGLKSASIRVEGEYAFGPNQPRW